MLKKSRRSLIASTALALAVGCGLGGFSLAQSTAVVAPLTWGEIVLNNQASEQTMSALGRTSTLSAAGGEGYDSLSDRVLSGISTISLENNGSARAIMNCDYLNSNCPSTSASQFARGVQKLPSNVPFVFARYSPMNAELVIDIYKSVRGAKPASPNTVGSGQVLALYHATFTPAQGANWAVKRYSQNPFLPRFSCTSGASAFCNIGMDGAEVAIGHAMRLVGAPVAVLAVGNSQVTSSVTTSGDETNQTTQVSQTANLGVTWYIAAPSAFQPLNGATTDAAMGGIINGSSAVICASIANANNCPPADVAYAGAVFNVWNGGSLPDSTLQAISSTTIQVIAPSTLASSPGATMQSFAAFAATLSTNSAFVQAFGNLLASESGNQVLYELQQFQPPSGLPGAPQLAPITASSATTNTTAQNSLYAFRNTTASFVSQAAGSGTSLNTSVGATGITANMATAESAGVLLTDQSGNIADVTSATYGSFPNGSPAGLVGIQTYTYGTCAANLTTDQCIATSVKSGVLPRLDSYTEVNMTTVYQDTVNP